MVDDGNTLGGTLRLTIDHRSPKQKIEAAAALWIRVGSGLEDNAAFTAWRTAFDQAQPKIAKAEKQHVRFEVPGLWGQSPSTPVHRGEWAGRSRPGAGSLPRSAGPRRPRGGPPPAGKTRLRCALPWKT